MLQKLEKHSENNRCYTPERKNLRLKNPTLKYNRGFREAIKMNRKKSGSNTGNYKSWR
jgi:hypothetical protein